jgi:hypothetical protein
VRNTSSCSVWMLISLSPGTCTTLFLAYDRRTEGVPVARNPTGTSVGCYGAPPFPPAHRQLSPARLPAPRRPGATGLSCPCA